MKWYMLDNYGHIHNKAEIASGTKKDAVVEYFAKIKQLDIQKFKKIYTVMTEVEYKAFERKPSSEGEFGDWLDMEKS